jgi:hypothetical protein
MNWVKLSFDVMLSTSASAPPTRIVVAIKIYRAENDELIWEQMDQPDYRMPNVGRCRVIGNDLLLYRVSGAVQEAVATLRNFRIPPGNGDGGIDYEFNEPRGPHWRGKGKWFVMYNQWVEDYAGSWFGPIGVSTGMHVASSGGGGFGGGPSWTINATGGTLLVEGNYEPHAKQHHLTFGGIGGGISFPKGPGISINYGSLTWPSGGLGDICYGSVGVPQPMKLAELTGHATILDFSGAVMLNILQKFMPGKWGAAKTPIPVGIGPGLSITLFFFGVPPVIGVVPAFCKATTVVWGVNAVLNASFKGPVSNLSGSVTLYHGYVEVED